MLDWHSYQRCYPFKIIIIIIREIEIEREREMWDSGLSFRWEHVILYVLLCLRPFETKVDSW